MIKNILWDFDGVLLPDKQYFYDLAHKHIGLTFEEFQETYPWSDWADMIKQRVDLIPISSERLPFMTKELMTQLMRDSAMMEQDHVHMLKKLSKQYNCYTATFRDARSTIKLIEQNNLESVFKGKMYYCGGTLGYDKSQSEFFTTILESESLIASETLFIDDHEGNIATAKSLGIKTIHYKYKKSDLEGALLQKTKIDR